MVTVDARIDLNALRENYMRIRSFVAGARISAVVKDNAYGHGLDLVVECLRDLADGFCVATIQEGISLRRLGVTQPIWILTGFHTAEELEASISYQLAPVVHSHYQISLILGLAVAKISVVVEVDTGMGRLGLGKNQLPEAINALEKKCEVVAVMSHFATADVPGHPYAESQIKSFEEATKSSVYPRSMSNSAGIFAWPQAHYDWVRPGLALYGITPFSDQETGEPHLRPVMTLESRIIAIREMQKGQSVGYGREWICPETMPVGVIGCGYGDGFPRSTLGGGEVWFDGSRAKIIGRVSMDSLVIDLRGLKRCSVGQRVELWGVHRRIEEVASDASTIPNDVLTRISTRVRRSLKMV